MRSVEEDRPVADMVRNFLEILLVVFVVLKLTHLIGWSWWWVTAPLTIPLAAWFMLFLLEGGLRALARALADRQARKRQGHDG